MENIEVAAALDEVADLLEIQGANPFRVRAYRAVARAARALPERLEELVHAGTDLTELEGVGREMASHIREYVETGSLARLDDLASEVPRSLTELVRLEGVGPGKARALWQGLGVESVAALEMEIARGRVQQLDGFGARTTDRIRRSIERWKALGRRRLLAEAELLAGSVVRHLEAFPGVSRTLVVGSVRRRRETVSDVNVLLAYEDDAEALYRHLVAHGDVIDVEVAEAERCRVLLRSGLAVDVALTTEARWGVTSIERTGSEGHVRSLMDMLSRTPKGHPTAGTADERDVYRAAGLAWVPPELREGRGEIDAAVAGALPRLVETEDLRGDLHMHSTWSDGRASIEEMARACWERGYQYLAVSDHSQSLTMAGGLDAARVRRQWDEIDAVRDRLDGALILKGLEVDILRDGSLDMPDSILEGLDIVTVSVHSYMDLGEAEMTERVLTAIRHPGVDVLAHPTGRILNRRPPYEIDVEAVLQQAAEVGVAVELNASRKRLDLSARHVRRARELGVPVSIGSDAHSVRALATMAHGVDQARRGWLEPNDVLNARTADDLRRWLSRRSA